MARWANRYWHICALVVILLLGLGLRLYALDSVPPGLFFDEAGKGLNAQAILRGEWPIFFPYSGGKEPLFMYLVAGLFLLLGQTGTTIRLASALCGTATLLTTYLLAREMFASLSPALPQGKKSPGIGSPLPTGGGQGEGELWQASFTSLLATLWLAVLYPAIHFSRVGFRAGSVALFETLAFWLFWRGWTSMGVASAKKTAAWFALSGAALGLCLYTYPTSRFVPFVLAAFVLFQIAFSIHVTRHTSHVTRHTSRFTFHALRFTLYASLTAAAAFLVFLPLGTYYLTHWSEFTARAAQVSVFNPALNGGDPWGTLAGNVLKTAGMFAVQGDPNWTQNLPGRPLLDPFTFILFVAGLLLNLVHSAGRCAWRRSASQFLILWFAIMLVPGLIAADLVPHFPRQTALLPVLAILAAQGAVQIGLWLSTKSKSQIPNPKPLTSHITFHVSRFTHHHAPRLWYSLVIIALAVITIVNAHDYFLVWATSEENYYAFDGHNVELARYLNRLSADDTQDDDAYLLLIPARYPSYIEGQPHRHLTIDFLYRGDAPHVYVPVSESATPAQIAAVCRERRAPVVVEWTTREFLDADPKGLVRYLLGKYGTRTAIDAGRGWAVSFFQMTNPSWDFAIAETLNPLGDDFGHQVQLIGANTGKAGDADVLNTTVESGGCVWVATRWKKTAAVDAAYSAFYYLRDTRGHLVAQASQALLDDDHVPITRWADAAGSGGENWGYAILPVFPGTPPGTYTVTVGLYDPATGRRHGRFKAGQLAGTEAPVGTITVTPPATLPAPNAVTVPQPRPVRYSDVPGLEFLGYELAGDTVAPGATVPIALYWRSTAPIAADAQVLLELRTVLGDVVATAAGHPAGASHPTSRWQVGETWYDWLDLHIPADAPTGDAMLTLALVTAAGGTSALAPIAPLRIEGRSHNFDVPPIEQPFQAVFGDGTSDTIELLGYRVKFHPQGAAPTPSPNPQSTSLLTCQLTLYWRCLAPMSTSYTVFTHLLDPAGQKRGQRDSIPCGGGCPTTGWIEGEVLVDTYEIAVDPDAPPGTYAIAVGWYDATTGQRLPTGDADYVLLAPIPMDSIEVQ